jgi:hypothetical protein
MRGNSGSTELRDGGVILTVDGMRIIEVGDRLPMEPNHTEERQEAHAFLDHLRDDQLSAVRGLLESMLSPLDRSLALSPIDDEPLTPEDAAAIDAGIASLERGEGIPHEEILREFGLAK